MIEKKEKELIILNNKCNFTKDEYVKYLKEINNIIDKYKENNIVICPSSCYLSLIDYNSIIIGSQNVSENDLGSYTGEISAKQLKSLNVKYTIVGHQETRQNNNETNSKINSKIVKLLKEEIIPILCIGELEKENEKVTIQYIKHQLNECLMELSDKDKEKIIIAYEPLWAIGDSITEDIPRIETILKEIKNEYQNNRLIYGGGLNTENIKLIKNSPYLSGYLLGNISLNTNKLELTLSELS